MSLHALLHMADATHPFTSDKLAQGMHTNAVVIRRTFAGLRRAKIVTSTKGHGGGWQLARPLDQIKLGDVYAALGAPMVFAMGNRAESPGCLVEQAVNRAMASAFAEAEKVLVKQLHDVTLAELAADVHARDKRGQFHLGHAASARPPAKRTARRT